MNNKLYYTTYLTYFTTMASQEELEILIDDDIINLTVEGKIHSLTYGELKEKSKKEIEDFYANH